MIGNALASIGHFFFGWPSVSVIVGIVALVIATLEPAWLASIVPDLRRTAIAIAIVAFTFTAISGKYYNDGLRERQSQWDAAVAQETVNGDAARKDAVTSIGPVPANRGVFNADSHNRNRKR